MGARVEAGISEGQTYVMAEGGPSEGNAIVGLNASAGPAFVLDDRGVGLRGAVLAGADAGWVMWQRHSAEGGVEGPSLDQLIYGEPHIKVHASVTAQALSLGLGVAVLADVGSDGARLSLLPGLNARYVRGMASTDGSQTAWELHATAGPAIGSVVSTREDDSRVGAFLTGGVKWYLDPDSTTAVGVGVTATVYGDQVVVMPSGQIALNLF